MLHLKYFLFLLIIPQFLYSQTTVTDTSLQRRIREKEESSQFALPPGFPTARLGYPVNNGVYTTGPEQDCNGAIPVCNSTYSQNSSYSGTGSTQEVPTSSCLGSREKNSVWYVFTVSASGNLAFQITPNAGSEDYDFALYNITGKSCSDIPSGAATESRCNYSATGGSTGLSSSGSNPSEPASGPNQSTLLPVTVGQTFVLVVSNYSSSQNGYTLNFASSGMTASVFDNVKPTVSSVNAPCGSSTVTVQMSEPIVCSTIASNGSDFSLSGPGGPFTISSATGVNCGTSTSQIQFTVSPALVMGNTYTLTVNQGVDANTLLDNCGNYADAGVTTNFTVSNPPASISGNNNICNGSSTALSANSGTSYAWSTGATTQTINVSPSSNTTYTVTVSNGTCGNSTANVTVSVKPSPVPDFTFPASVCAGTPVTFTNTTQMPPSCGGNGLINCTTIGSSTQCGFISTCQATSLTAPVVVATWAFGNASTSFNPNPPNPSQTYNTPGTYTVSLYMSLPITGCSNTISHDIVVLPNAGTLSITGDTLICPGGTANLTASGSASYTWTQGGNTISNNATISVTPASTTTYTVAAPGCSSNITKTITVVVSNSQTVSVTPNNPTVCTGGSASLTASGATTYSWSPATGLSATTGANVTASPASSTTYTVTGYSGSCSSSGYVTVNVSNSLNVSVTPASSTICPGNVSALTASGATTYSWQPATGLSAQSGTSVNANPTSTTTYTVTGYSSGCSGVATTVVTVAGSVNVSVSPQNASICPSQSANLTASGAGNYSWYPATGLNTTNGGNVIATPSSTTTYTVIGSSGSCSDTAYTTVSVVNSLNISVTPLIDTICAGGTAVFTASGAGTYTWSPSIGLSTTNGATVSASPNSTQSYTVIGGNSGCADTAIVNLVVSNPPNITISPLNNTICPSESITLTASGANTYSWYPSGGLNVNNQSSVTATPTNSTVYTVVGSVGSCTAQSTVSVNIFNSVSVSVVPGSAAICPGGNAQLTANGATNYTWFPSNTLSNNNTASVVATPANTTQYTVIGSTSTCTDTATVLITVANTIHLSSTPSTDSICAGKSSSFNLNGANSYTWFPATSTTPIGNSGFQASPSITTNYTIVGYSGSCSDTLFVPLIVKALPNVTVNPASVTICPGSSILLNASGATNYTWNPVLGLSASNGQSVTASPGVSTNYTVTGLQNGCSDTAISKITVTILPNVALSASDTLLCEGEKATVIALGLSAFNWSPTPLNQNTSGTSVDVKPSTTTIYTASGASGGCLISSSIKITVKANPNISVSTNADTICFGHSALLTAHGANTYSWQPAGNYTINNDSSITVAPLTTIVYTAIGYNGKCKDTSIITQAVHPKVNVVASPDTSVCPGKTVSLSATGANTFSWSNGVTVSTNTVTVTSPKYIRVTGWIGNCFGKDSVLLTINPTPKANFDFIKNPVSAFDPNAQIIDLSHGALYYQYTSSGIKDTVFKAANPTIKYITENGDTFMVKQIITNQYGCTDSISKEFIVQPEFALYIPNAFTPNKDGTNEGFGAKGFGVIEFKMFIFDRWGNKLFTVNSLNDVWDGKINGNDQPADIYIYKAELKTFNLKNRSLQGTFNLIR